MVKRSSQASQAGIKQAKQAFARKGWTQENLALEVSLKTRQPVWRFFTGRPIEHYTFKEICSVLGLNWREIAENPPEELSEPGEQAVLNIDALVQQVRSQRFDKIQNQCGTLQLLDISRPVGVEDIYTDVNILEEIASQQWLENADLQNLTPEEFDRFGLGEVSQKQISGMRAVETYSKLRVLGKPGSGKTTFLQHLAIECNQGKFAANRVSIFITLRDFADESREAGHSSLLNYIREEFLTSGISDPSVIETLLREGRDLLLLDGLDEVGFYKQYLDLLLVKWDETRGIERDEVYRGFLLPQKLRLLSQVAAVSFEQGHYFFEQRAIEEHIGDYIRDLPNAPTEPEELQLDSEVVLKAIELQHGLLTERVRGIFSFSYLAFQEYFTARKIVASHNLQALEKPLQVRQAGSKMRGGLEA